MFGSVTLEVGIGLILVFLLVSILCSTVREVMESLLKSRSAYLERGIRELLKDKDATGLVKTFYDHPLIASLFNEDYTPRKIAKQPSILALGRNLPSYIPSRNFAIALMDIATRGQRTDAVSSDPNSPKISLETVRMNILNLENPFVQRALLTAIDSAQGSMDVAVKNIETWFDSSMDRVSGWYKRSTQWIIFWVALIVSVSLNINTITIADYLYRNDVARKALVAKAEVISKDTTYMNKSFQEVNKEITSMNLPIGWSKGRRSMNDSDEKVTESWWKSVFAPVLGWLITALAATMGAPFWFDLLNKIMVIRSTVKPHEKSPEESSEDRQAKKVPVVAPGGNIQPQQAGPDNPPAPFRPETAGVSNARDKESNIDLCDLEITDSTLDEDLPPAKGGVG